ncbi:hypothetical protein ACFOMD_01870 [Sphingoaurantiacus capsulatus]|uniref:Uncharacterized protein n=1 Tax=Sphingoaurantiacus capsulatus TaxID=1771310 RepID=A0ABV7X9I1_9SPHN
MSDVDLTLLDQALDRLREANALLEQTDAGVATLHLDACIAALESRLRRADGTHPLHVMAS